MQKIEVLLVKGKETKGTYVYEEELGEGGKGLPLDLLQFLSGAGHDPIKNKKSKMKS